MRGCHRCDPGKQNMLADGSFFDHMRTFGDDREYRPRGIATPTDALPGTPEKLEVLKARLNAGQELHHPRDPRRTRSGRWCVYVSGDREVITLAKAAS